MTGMGIDLLIAEELKKTLSKSLVTFFMYSVMDAYEPDKKKAVKRYMDALSDGNYIENLSISQQEIEELYTALENIYYSEK